MTERVWRLRAMSVADLLDETIRLYRHNFLTFVGIVAVLQAPMSLLSTFLSAYYAQRYLTVLQESVESYGALPSDEFMVGYIAYLVVILLVGAFNWLVVNNLVTAALARAIANRYLDEPVSIGGAYRSILRRFGSLFGALLLLVLIDILLVVVVAVTMLIPCLGIFLALLVFALVLMINIRLTFVIQAVVLEDCSPRQALSRSWDLVQGYGWRTLGVYLLIWLFSLLIVSGPSYALTFGLQALEVSLVVQTAVSGVLTVALTVFYMPIRLTGLTLLYYDLRIRKEGLDLELQAATLGEGTGEPPLALTPRDFLAAGSTQASKSEKEIQAQIDKAARLHDTGDLQGAIQAYWAAIARRPHDALLQNDLGLALHQAGYLDAALLRFQTAAELEPDDSTAYYNLALLQRDRGRLDAAREALRTYLKLEPDATVRASVQNDPALVDLLMD